MHMLIRSLLALTLLVTPALASAAGPKSEPPPQKKGKLVFVTTTGLEDIGALGSSFKHAKIAQESGYLEKVAWLAYGRSVVVVDPTVKAVPDTIRSLAKEAKDSGVELIVCGNALSQFGIDAKTIEPQARVVPQGVVELARLVSEGYEVIRY